MTTGKTIAQFMIPSGGHGDVLCPPFAPDPL